MWKRFETKKSLDLAGKVSKEEMDQFQEAEEKIEHQGGGKLLTCNLCRSVCKMLSSYNIKYYYLYSY